MNRKPVLNQSEIRAKWSEENGTSTTGTEFSEQGCPASRQQCGIVSHTHIKPHQQVFQITKRLMDEGLINGRRVGKEWLFAAGPDTPEAPEKKPAKSATQQAATGGPLFASAFEELARQVMSQEFDTELTPGRVNGVHKQFDLVSKDQKIIGDAKYYTAVNGTGLPPAKFATIAEYVWLLEKTTAKRRFLVFGNDRRVPEWWLERYGNVASVAFYYLSDDGALEKLN